MSAKILIIDDDLDTLKLVGVMLQRQGYEISAAADGRQGLAKAIAEKPDVILLDVMMPEMDGWELLQNLRTHPQTANIPVIVCSVFNDPELAYSLGASLFLPKPVSRDSVLTTLHQLGVV